MGSKIKRIIRCKQAAATVVLGIAALGATHVPGHQRMLIDLNKNRSADSATEIAQAVYGSNNLLGSIGLSDLDANRHSSDLVEEHLVSGMMLSQAGDTTSLLERLHVATSNFAPMPAPSIAPINASAVPEPASAGMLLTMLLPTLVRRRRNRG